MPEVKKVDPRVVGIDKVVAITNNTDVSRVVYYAMIIVAAPVVRTSLIIAGTTEGLYWGGNTCLLNALILTM